MAATTNQVIENPPYTLSSPSEPAPHPAFAGQVRYQSIPRQPDDEAATADTVRLMAAAIRADAKHPVIAAATKEATANAATEPQRIAGIFWWIKRHVHFRDDADTAAGISGLLSEPSQTEVLIRPADLLAMPAPAGDCDDFSMLAAAMLRAAGIPAYLVTIAADPGRPDEYSHIYVVAAGASGHTAVDASHGPRPAWQAPATGKTRAWDIDAMSRHGLGFSDPITFTSNGTPWWGEVITDFSKAGAQVLQMQGTPQNYFTQSTPQGTVTMRQPTNAAAPFTAPVTSAAGGMGMLILAGVAVLVVILLSRRND